MTNAAGDWERVKEVFQSALERSPETQPAFLDEACGDDRSLRAEVESLLLAHEQAGSFAERPAVEGVTGRSLQRGDRLGPYEIVELVGAGGMGDVYRARDTKLGRDVAIKVLPPVFTSDADRLARFEREARVLAALNHPHIGAIYGLEHVDGVPALVLELVEGPTLADRLAKGRLPLRDALAIAVQIAEALEAAHDRGIVHRDLKPANIKITPDGVVKVLDFGLAKVARGGSAGPGVDATQSPVTLDGTQDGVILGTAPYMSPEQAQGHSADARSDIWAFGLVLYEMLTGKPGVSGTTTLEVLSNVLKSDLDWSALPASTPPALRSLLRRCVQKERNRRVRDIADARLQIEETLAEPAATAAAGAPGASGRFAWTALALVTLIAAGLAIWALRPVPPLPEMRVEITTPPTTRPTSFAISPDGRTLAFVATSEGRPKLWLRPLDSAARPLAGTDFAGHPFWSPDGRSVGFYANDTLKKIDIGDGAVQTLTPARYSDGGGAWNKDGTIFFIPGVAEPVFRISADGGEPVRVTPPTSQASWPALLPDGRHFLYRRGGAGIRGVYVAGFDGSERRLVDAAYSAVFHAPSGQMLFLRQGTVFAQHLDPGRLELTGSLHTVAGQVDGGIVALSASAAGPIAIRFGSGGHSRQFVWFDRSGKELKRVGDAVNEVSSPSISPDGKRVAVVRVTRSGLDIWLLELARGVLSRFTTTDARNEVNPVWSPDGHRIVFQSRGPSGASDLYEQPTTGGGKEEPLLVTPEDKSPCDWSRDGRFVLYATTNPKTPGNRWGELWALPMDGAGKSFPVVQSSFQAQAGQFSPDGKWIAYESNESGHFEIYVQPFPGPGQKTLVSKNGGAQVRWRRDGKELFYIAPDDHLMAVRVRLPSTGETVEIETPVSLFDTHVGGPVQAPLLQQYVVDDDGQRFLMNTEVQDSTPSPIIVILNWKPKP